MQARKKKYPNRTVLVGTTIIYDPRNPDHRGKDTEVISRNSMYSRKLVTVIKGTGEIYDEMQHQGKETEIIAASAAFKRRTELKEKITVLYHTATIYDKNNPDHCGKMTERIFKHTFKQRQIVTVLKGTAIQYDKAIHANAPTEEISYSTLCKRRVKGIDIVTAETSSSEEENISNRKLNQDEYRVLKGTATIYDENLHRGQKTEIINSNKLHQRKPVTVVLGTGEIFNPRKHQGMPTAITTYSAARSKRRRDAKKQANVMAGNDSDTSDNTAIINLVKRSKPEPVETVTPEVSAIKTESCSSTLQVKIKLPKIPALIEPTVKQNVDKFDEYAPHNDNPAFEEILGGFESLPVTDQILKPFTDGMPFTLFGSPLENEDLHFRYQPGLDNKFT